MHDLNGRIAVITGAASGFGREFARVAVSRGMQLVLADVDAAGLELIVEELRERDVEVVSRVTDVSQASEVQALADLAMEHFGKIHLLFNNAGVAAGGLVWENTDADWQWVLGVNVMSVVHATRIFTPLMMAHGEPARIVNTASAAGLITAPNMGVYNVSKHAVVALSETLFHDLQSVQSAVRVSVLCPAFVPTAITHSFRNRPDALLNSTPPTASMLAAHTASVKAVAAGKLSAADIATLTFQAIDADQFYIVPHGRILDAVSSRLRDIVSLQNPTDGFAHTTATRTAS
jgi:NAD(P)-dependent dehydrogenase (short-subunit alcohol dehydrogenase family)